MSWLVFALAATALFSLAGVLDKYLLSSHARDSKSYLVCQILIQQMICIPVLWLMKVDFIYPASALALLAGMLQVIPALCYLKAVQMEEISRVNALEYLYPISRLGAETGRQGRPLNTGSKILVVPDNRCRNLSYLLSPIC